MDLINRVAGQVATQQAQGKPATAPAPKSEQPPAAPQDGYAGSVPTPDPGIYKKPNVQPKVETEVKTKPDGKVERDKDGNITGAKGELATQATTTGTYKKGPVSLKMRGQGTLHADGQKDGSVKGEIKAEQKKDGVTTTAEVTGEVKATRTPDDKTTSTATATGKAGIEAKSKDGNHKVSVQVGGSVSQGPKGPGSSVDLSISGQTRIGPVHVRGEGGVKGEANDGKTLDPKIYGKVQIGNPKLPVSVHGECSGPIDHGTPSCNVGIGGKF